MADAEELAGQQEDEEDFPGTTQTKAQKQGRVITTAGKTNI